MTTARHSSCGRTLTFPIRPLPSGAEMLPLTGNTGEKSRKLCEGAEMTLGRKVVYPRFVLKEGVLRLCGQTFASGFMVCEQKDNEALPQHFIGEVFWSESRVVWRMRSLKSRGVLGRN
ncbi:hypothetical protein CDAR_417721 [Caerostris darwini]|uniref:Uncharacterized protein n=1 Tax=Caerostris darwini TaxID=1538125 RepID=A0AAV4VBY0_9ARAC|nr:hypothetical protein CDAR_417721 [Caerostris darwini]